MNLPIEAVVTQLQPDDDFEDEKPLCNVVKTKEQVELKRMKKWIERTCIGRRWEVSIEIASAFNVFNKCIGLQGFLSMLEIESERYVAQNGRDIEVSEEEFSAFLGVIILMGIHKLPSIKSYWVVDDGLGNPLIQNTVTETRFMEILRNINFTDNQKLPSKDSME